METKIRDVQAAFDAGLKYWREDGTYFPDATAQLYMVTAIFAGCYPELHVIEGSLDVQ